MKQLLYFLAFILAFLLTSCNTKPLQQDTQFTDPSVYLGVGEGTLSLYSYDTAYVTPAIYLSTEDFHKPEPIHIEQIVDVDQILMDTFNKTDTIYYLGERICDYKSGLTEKVSVMQIETFTYHPEALTKPGVTVFVESEIKYFAKPVGYLVFPDNFLVPTDSSWNQIFTFEDFAWIKQESHP